MEPTDPTIIDFAVLYALLLAVLSEEELIRVRWRFARRGNEPLAALISAELARRKNAP